MNGPDLPDKNPIKEMKINNKIVTDSMTIVNEFNKFFANILYRTTLSKQHFKSRWVYIS